MRNEDPQSHAVVPTRPPLLSKQTSRRTLLAGATAIAVAGGTAALLQQQRRDDGSTRSEEPPPPTVISDPARRAAHLLRRAGLGGSAQQIQEFAGLSREEAADRLLNFESVDNAALEARIDAADFDHIRLADNVRWWYTRLLYTARPLEERITLFWHGLLTSQASKLGAQRFKLMVLQNELFRAKGLGKFDDLLQAVSKDPAMLIYLDTVESTKDHPNENYARELMELFSMGVGNYTEDDVREAARAFTGWRVSALPRPAQPLQGVSEADKRKLLDDAARAYVPEFQVNAKLQDTGPKTFLGQTGNFGGEDIVRIVAGHPATGRFITRRLFSEFAYPNPEEEVVARLVRVWDSSGHDIKSVLREILVSDEFYSERAYRSIVRAPVLFIVNAVRGLHPSEDFRAGLTVGDRYVKGMDQQLFEPPNVAGWPGGEFWLSSSTFFARVNFLDQWLLSSRGRQNRLTALEGTGSAVELVDRALAIFVDGNVQPAARQAIIDLAETISNQQQRVATVAYLVLASPEYQLI